MADNAFYNALQQNAQAEAVNYTASNSVATSRPANPFLDVNSPTSYQNQKKINEQKSNGTWKPNQNKSDKKEKSYLQQAQERLDTAQQNLGYVTDPVSEAAARKEYNEAKAALDQAKAESNQQKTSAEVEAAGGRYTSPQPLGQKDNLPDISNLSQLSIQQGPQKVGEQELVPGRANQFGYRATNTITGAAKGFGADMMNAGGTVAAGLSQLSERLGGDTGDYAGWATDEVSRTAIPIERDSNKYAQQMQEAADIQAASDRLAASGQEDINQAKEGLSGAGRFAVDIGTNAIQMAGDALATVLTAGAVNPLTSMFVRSAGGAAREARNEGASTAQQIAYGAVRGGIEVATEKMFDGLAGIYGAGGADDVVELVIDKMAKSDTGRTALRTMFSGIGEAVEEGISGATEPLTQAIYKGIDSIPKGYNKEQASDVLYSMLVGFAMGGAGGSVNIANGNDASANAELRQVDAIRNSLAGTPMENNAGTWLNGGQNQQTNNTLTRPTTVTGRNGRTYEGVGQKAQNPERAAQNPANATDAGGYKEGDSEYRGYQITVEKGNYLNGLRTHYRITSPDGRWVGFVPISSKASAQITEQVNDDISLHAEAQQADASSPAQSEPATPVRTVEAVQAELDPILNEISEIDKAIAENDVAMKQMMSEADSPDDKAIIRGQANPSANEGRQSFEDIDAADTASMEEKYGRGNAAETQNTASEPTTQADTPTEQQSAGTTDSEQFNSKTETTTDTNGQSARPGIPPQRPTGIKTDTSYAELGQQYGTIEQGENPVRDSQTPQRTAPDNKVSESVRTVQEAAATPDTRLQNIQSAVVDGKFSFVPIPNTERAAQAEAKLKKDGWQKMLRDWTSAVRSGQASADLVAQGAVLLNNAANSSECSGSEYIDLMMDYVQLERSTGQALQAARILKTLSPEGKLYGLQKVVQNMNERDNTSSKGNSKNANSDDAISALTESTDGRYSIPESLIDEYRQQTTDEGRDAVIDKMQQAIADQIPSSLGDKFTAIRYLNMLGNFKTQVRNVAGNTGMMLVQKAKNTVRSALETVASVASGGRYQKQYASLYNPRLIATAWNDIQNTSGLKDTAMGEKKYSSVSTQFERGIEEKRNPFKFGDNRLTRALGIANKQGPAGKLLSAYNKATSWAMEAGDDIFVSLNYTDALAGYLQAHKISADQWTSLVAEADSDPSSTAAQAVDDARAFAIKQAQEATFRDTNRVSEFAQNFDKNWRKLKIVTQGIAPFRKTPANVGVRMEEYSPLGFVNTAVKAIQAKNGSENVTGADVVDSLSKSLTGTGLAIVGFALAQAGRARTKSDDDKQEAFDKLRGLQDYSITVGDGLNLTLDWAVPASASIFMGVELFNLVRDGNISPNDSMKVIGNLTAPMLEMSMLSGVNDALNNISSFNEDTDALPQFLLNSAVGYLFQGLTNTLAGQFEQANEEYRQSYYTNPDNKILPTSVQKKLAQAGNKTPGIDWQASDYIDAWGRKQKNEGTTAQRYANALLNPSYTSRLSSKETAVDSELQRLYDYGKDIDGFPSVLPQTAKRNTTVNGTKLSPEEYEEYATTKGQESLRLVSNLIKSDTYKALDDEGKAAAISDCYSYAKYIADSKIAESRGEEYTNGTYTGLMTGVDKSGAAYDKTALNSSNFVEYTAFKIGLDRAVDASDYKAIDKLMNSYGKMNSNLKTVVSERNPVARALSTWKDAGLNSQTYYAVQRELVKSQRKLDKSQKTGSVVELDALANVNMPEEKKKRLIDSLPDYGSKTVKGVYDILYNYGFNSKQINEFWNISQDWVYKDTGDTQSSQKAGTLQPLEAYYAIEQLPGLDDAQKQDIYNQMKEVANVPYKINDWGNYTFGSERSYYQSGRSRQQFGGSGISNGGNYLFNALQDTQQNQQSQGQAVNAFWDYLRK